MKRFIPVLLLLVMSGACADPDTSEETAPEAKRQTYTATGIVKSITPSKTYVVLDHEEITGYMEAMTMPFRLQDSTVVAGIAPHDSVHFTLTVEGNIAYITALHKLGRVDN